MLSKIPGSKFQSSNSRYHNSNLSSVFVRRVLPMGRCPKDRGVFLKFQIPNKKFQVTKQE